MEFAVETETSTESAMETKPGTGMEADTTTFTLVYEVYLVCIPGIV